MKIEIFKTKKKFRKGGFHTNPNVSWELILYIASILTIASLVFGVSSFLRINEEFTADRPQEGSHIKIVKKERIEKVLEYFSLRKQKSAEILYSSSPIIDPSL
ncbi:MAG: hypothetical protein WAV15_00655 [Minisyncoccia bacterium]